MSNNKMRIRKGKAAKGQGNEIAKWRPRYGKSSKQKCWWRCAFCRWISNRCHCNDVLPGRCSFHIIAFVRKLSNNLSFFKRQLLNILSLNTNCFPRVNAHKQRKIHKNVVYIYNVLAFLVSRCSYSIRDIGWHAQGNLTGEMWKKSTR